MPGGPLTYTIVVNYASDQQGPGTAAIADTFPAGFTGFAFTSSATNATGNTASGSGNISDPNVVFQPGGSVTYTVTGTISPTATGPLTNTAVVSPSTTDDNANNNASTATTNLPTDLAVSKTDGVATAAQGSTLTYTIVVSNPGSNAVTGATLTDVLPPNTTLVNFVAPPGWTTNTATAGQVSATNTAALGVGTTATFSLVVTVNGNATGAITNTATVVPPQGTADVNPANNTAIDIDTVSPVVATTDLQITKTDGVLTVTPGSTLTYQIVVSNAGPSAVTGATVADIFPPNLTNTTFTASGTGGANGFTNGNGNINQTVNLPVGATITYTVTGTVSPDAAGAISNTATVTAPAGVTDTSPANNIANDTDTVTLNTALADLAVSKSDGVSTVAPGGGLTYSIVVSNLGTVPITGATLVDALPPNATFVSVTPPANWTVTSPTVGQTGTLTATNTAPLAAGTTATFLLTVLVNNNAAGAVTNTATITTPIGVADVNGTNNIASDTDTVAVTPTTADLSITKSDGVDVVTPGSPVSYTITVSNAGQTAVTGAMVADVFPPTLTNVTFTAQNNNGATGGANGTGNINQTVNLPVGGSIVYTVTATVSPSATGAIANTASVTTPAGVTDTNPTNNTATDIDTVNVTIAQTDLTVTKTDNATSVAAGSPITYTIVVTNAGTAPVTGATLTDVVPANTTFTSFTAPTGWTASTPAAGGTGTVTATNTDPLAPGATATFTLVVAATANAAGTISNTATITPPTNTIDVNPLNNTATDIDTVTGTPVLADLGILKTDGVVTVTPGGAVTYTIVVSNSGPNAVANAHVTDTFPGALTNITYTASGTGGATGFTNGTGNIDQLVDLPVGATITYTVNATVSPNATNGTMFTNTAAVAAPQGVTDANQVNNSSTDTDTVATTTTATTDLNVFKTDGSATAVAGQNIAYTITVTNLGTTAVTGATLTDLVPPNTTFVSFTAPAGWTSTTPAVGGTGTVTTTNTTALDSGAAASFSLVVLVSAGATGAITNTATIAPPTGTADTNPLNNISSDTDTIIATPPESTVNLSITKTDGASTATPGAPITYTITVSNATDFATATNAIVTDVFPPNITGVSYTATGTAGTSGFSNGSGNINQMVTIPSGGSITYIVTGTVSPNAIGAIENTATVTPPADVTDVNLANNASTDIDTLTPQNDVTVSKTDGVTTAVPGTTTTYTIVVSNLGPSTATNVAVSDPLPAGVTSFTWSGNGHTNVSGPINDTIATLPPGVSVTYTVAAAISASATGSLMNTVTVTAANDVGSSNNAATDTDTLTPAADLGITKTDGSLTYTPGMLVTYTITVTNSGPSNVVGASVADTVPAGLTGVTWTSSTTGSASVTSGATGSGNSLAATVNIAAGAGNSVIFTVSGTAQASLTGNLTNTATVSAPAGTTDSITTNNSATDTDTPAPVADLGINKTDGATTVTPGAQVIYTITVTNSGPSNVVGATVADTIPRA